MSTNQLNSELRLLGGELRLAAGPREPFATLRAAKTQAGVTQEWIMEEVATARLRGRGGAWFPAARKWAAARAAFHAEGRVLVANGGEDEPGSAKDRVLLEHYPDLVVEGAALAALAVEAAEIVFYVNHRYEDALLALRKSLGRAEAAGVFDDFGVRVVEAPSEYVAGEETAALEVLEGRPAVPRVRPPFPSEQGYRGRPTVVNNIETLANVPGIVFHGPSWFRAVGTAEAPGTMLFSLEGDIPRPGVYELPLGTPLRAVLVDYGGAAADLSDVGAVRAGGASSPYLTRRQCFDLTLDPEALRPYGTLGAGVLRVLAPDRCMVSELIDLAAFFAAESCGACPPCRMETTSFHGLLQQVAAGKARPDVLERIEELFDFAADKGRCGFIRMPQVPFRSAIKGFADDFAAHLAGRPCPNGMVRVDGGLHGHG